MIATSLTQDDLREQSSFISKVYGWMSVAMAITAIAAMVTASTPPLIQLITGNTIVFMVLIIGELILVAFISGIVSNLSASLVSLLFIIYSVFNGLTFSVIFVAFTGASIASTFFITGATFAGMSLYGYTTKRDLTSMGNLLMMALLGLIIASVVNLFLSSPALYWATTYIGILIFVGLVAYDTQKIKALSTAHLVEGSDAERKSTILGALALYLDFINLFLLLLRIFGRRK